MPPSSRLVNDISNYVKGHWKKSELFQVSIEVKSETLTLDFQTDESYKMYLKSNSKEPKVFIQAVTVFGARHALETLSQLITYDDLLNQFRIPDSFAVGDSPSYR